MKRHAGAHDICLDELKSKRAMYRKDAAGLSSLATCNAANDFQKKASE